MMEHLILRGNHRCDLAVAIVLASVTLLSACAEQIVMDTREEMPVVVNCVLTDSDIQYLKLFYAKRPSENGYRIIDDADIVIVHAGTNDWATQAPLGNSDSTDKLEFNGALNIIMSGLRAKYPTALIIFDAIMERQDYDAPVHGGTQMNILTSSYSECIKNKCKEYHFLFYDTYNELGLDFTYDLTNQVYATTNDGLHPNIEGAKIIGRKLAGFIKSH